MTAKYGFIGGGNMATAILAGALKQGVCQGEEVLVSDISEERLAFLAGEHGVRTSPRNADAIEEAECVVLAVKPQVFPDLAGEIAPLLKPSQTVISILAGVRSSVLKDRLGGHGRIVRVMPNLPATVGKGVSGIAVSPEGSEEAVAETEQLLSTVGGTVRVEEELLDAVTAVSGSGPGYVFRIAEILIGAGVQAGLTEEQASLLVGKTLEGASAMLLDSDAPASELCKRVCSPGGTTLAGLDAMAKGGLEKALVDGVLAARDRSKELSGG